MLGSRAYFPAVHRQRSQSILTSFDNVHTCLMPAETAVIAKGIVQLSEYVIKT